jgi:hypothetical protein
VSTAISPTLSPRAISPTTSSLPSARWSDTRSRPESTM